MIESEILLIEDNPLDRELTIRSLHEQGLNGKIIVATDGAEAIDIITRLPLHSLKIALVDLKLPKVDGLEVIKAMRAHEATKLLPIIVFSSSEEESDIRRCYEAGANSYIVKPIRLDEIGKTMAQVSNYWRSLNKTSHGLQTTDVYREARGGESE